MCAEQKARHGGERGGMTEPERGRNRGPLEVTTQGRSWEQLVGAEHGSGRVARMGSAERRFP